MTARDEARLVGVHPALVDKLRLILADMDGAHSPMFVVQGVRTDEQQEALYAQGRTEVGEIVTYKDGVTTRSNHQVHDDGLGYAVDCAFVDVKPFDPLHPWGHYGTLVEAAGLKWGGHFLGFADLPHAELPA